MAATFDIPSTTHPTKAAAKPVEIIPGLDLSSFPNTIDPKYTHVLNMCTMPNHPASHHLEILHIQLLDWDNITPHIPGIVQYIDRALQNPDSRVLVHCALGINRSAAAVTTYLCHHNNTNSSIALGYLKSKKPDVQPSVLFLQQIDQYFGYQDTCRKDPLVSFHERLQRRKAGVLVKEVTGR
jgi:protein-tyrosine phosphatase